jgi:hypothetical protein
MFSDYQLLYQIGITLGLLWLLWIAFALLMIWLELHWHNAREQKRAFRAEWNEDR